MKRQAQEDLLRQRKVLAFPLSPKDFRKPVFGTYIAKGAEEISRKQQLTSKAREEIAEGGKEDILRDVVTSLGRKYGKKDIRVSDEEINHHLVNEEKGKE